MEDLSLYKDYTLKAPVSDLVKLEASLRTLHADFTGIDFQKDTYFKTDLGKLKFRNGTIEKLITHYDRAMHHGVERTTVYRYDLNPSKEQMDELFGNNAVSGTTEKERGIYHLSNVKIHIDILPDGKMFIEIEAIDRENRFSDAELREQCFNVLRKLGIDESLVIRTGYFEE